MDTANTSREKVSRKFWLNFQGPCALEPIIWRLAQNSPAELTCMIGSATINKSYGLMGIELIGYEDHINNAVRFLEDQDVKVDPIEINVVE